MQTLSVRISRSFDKAMVLESSEKIPLCPPVAAALSSVPQPKPTARPKLSLVAVTVLIFYEVSGGPFGIEDAVGAAGPLFALLGFMVLPLVWSVPEALMTAELSSAFPEDGGYVCWVTAGFGSFWGFQVGWWSWLSGVADNALYPVLFLDYLHNYWPFPPEARPAALVFISLLLTWVNWRGLQVVSKTSLFLCVFSLAPFVVMVGLGAPQVAPERLVSSPAVSGVHWGRFLNVMFWNLNYWDGVSTLAAEVHEPSRTLPRALGAAVLLVMGTYLVPLLVGIGCDRDIVTNHSKWHDGHFAAVARELGGEALAGWVVLAAALSNIGLFEAEMSSDAYQLLGMAEKGMIPAAFARRSQHDTPTVAILCSATGICVVSLLSFSQIVEILNFLYAFAVLFEFASLIRLRISQPEILRPFQIPLGTVGLAVMLLPATVMLLCVVLVASWLTLAVSLVLMLIGLQLPYLLKLARELNWCQFYHGDSDLF